MKFERFTDPTDITADRIGAILAEGDVPIVQFSKPLSDLRLLDNIDSLCRTYADRLEVRFFGFYSQNFDASVLSRVPHVQWLSVDCLTRATSIEQLYALRYLRKLSLGIYELDIPDILARIHASGLRDLRVIETRKNNIDLAPLEQCQELRHLFVGSHLRGINVLKKLNGLTNLTLGSISKKQSLAVVSEIRGLTKLRIVLGGRSDIDEVKHSGLAELEVIRVLGLSSMGDLSRFPVLEKLRIEDQIRLASIDLSVASRRLRELAVVNCKKLAGIGSLTALNDLQQISIGLTSVDFDRFVASLPKSAHTVRFWTGKGKVDDGIRVRLDTLGYKEFHRVS